MSEEWEFYPCQMGEHRASIFFDHGIRVTLDSIAPPNALNVRITMKTPRPDGLSSQDEFDALVALEKDFERLVAEHDALYVGRITVDGQRFLHAFTVEDEAAWRDRIASLGRAHDYRLTFFVEPDPAHDAYWKQLFPSADDWQVIADMRVLDSLKNHGDDPTIPRKVDHLAYLPSAEAAEAFVAWAKERGFSIASVGPGADGRTSVALTHETTVGLGDITKHTIPLNRKATQLRGHYDGWGSVAQVTADS